MARTLIHSTSAFGQDIMFGCYGTCDTAAGTAAKVVTCAGFTSDMLIAGCQINIKFTNGNSVPAQTTLNINSTGAKNAYCDGSYANIFANAGEIIPFVYNGTAWVAMRMWHTGNLAGGAYESVATAATANTLAKRQANGYLYAVYFNQSSSAETMTTSSNFMYSNSDGFLRKGTIASAKTALGLGSAASKNVQYGTVSMGSGAYVDVTFATAFSAVPYVVAAYYTTGSQPSGAFGTLKLSTVTKNGFKIMQQGTSGITVTACWIAML